MEYPFNSEWGLFSSKVIPVPIICKDFISCTLLVFYVVLRLLTYAAGAFAVIMILWSGIILITQYQKAKEVRDRLIWAILGLVLALISWGLVKVIEFTISQGTIGLIFNITYAQQLQFTPSRIGCTRINIFDVLRGEAVPSGLLGQCLLWLAIKFLTVIYTISMLSAIGFIIYGGMKLYLKPGDKTGWDYVTWAIIGVIITISAYSIVKAIEFSLTH